jgi:hypothetical protein
MSSRQDPSPPTSDKLGLRDARRRRSDDVESSGRGDPGGGSAGDLPRRRALVKGFVFAPKKVVDPREACRVKVQDYVEDVGRRHAERTGQWPLHSEIEALREPLLRKCLFGEPWEPAR